MSIKKVMSIGFIIILVALLVTGSILFLLKKEQEELINSFNLRYYSYRVADELRQSSDDLTKLARLYVTTKDSEPEQAAEYLRQYNAILAIRDGKIPRPEGYEKVYWDIAAIELKNPTPNSNVQISIKEQMRQLNFTEQEFELLEQSENNSNELVKLETAAINLVDGNSDSP